MGARPLAATQPAAVQRPAQRIDDTAQQPLAHGHVHHPAGAKHFIPGVKPREIPQQHDPDLILVQVERNAEHASGKLQKLLKPRPGQPGDPGNPGGQRRDNARFARREPRGEPLARLPHGRKHTVEHALH